MSRRILASMRTHWRLVPILALAHHTVRGGDRRGRICTRLAGLRPHLGAWLRVVEAPAPTPGPEDRRRLRALGYVGDDGG